METLKIFSADNAMAGTTKMTECVNDPTWVVHSCDHTQLHSTSNQHESGTAPGINIAPVVLEVNERIRSPSARVTVSCHKV